MSVQIKVNSKFNNALAKAANAKIKALKESTFDLLDKSVERTPINKNLSAETRGDLRKSGKASFETNKGFVSFGGSIARDYAVIQHERTDFNHNEGEAKYLEKTFEENKDKYYKDISKEYKKAFD